MGRNYL